MTRHVAPQVPLLREALLRGRDWRSLASQQAAAQFGPAGAAAARQRLAGMLASFDMLCELEALDDGGSRGDDSRTRSRSGGGSAANPSGTAALLAGAGADEAAVLTAPVRVVCCRQVRWSMRLKAFRV